jgi:hypothetical protein
MKAAHPETLALLTAEKPLVGKIAFVDHLKVLMTVLVVLHHSFITYGAPGSWYFQQKTTHMWALLPMTIFVATNQSFFMGFFFFLSALFVRQSYQKKGAGRFVADRLKRLGIPLAFYSFILSPVLNYTVEHYGYGEHHSFIEYLSGYHQWIDFGVMWFVAALIVFNFAFLLFKSLHFNFSLKIRFPTNRQIILFGIFLAVLSFLTRLLFPTGWTLYPTGFQLGYFPQYIFLFITGLVASKNKWLDQLNLRQGRNMANMACLMVLVILPAIFIAYLVLKFSGNNFTGGWNWVSLSYSLWEQITGIMIMTALLCIASFKWNKQTPFSKQLSANAYGAYIFHPVVLITLSLLIKGWGVDPVVKLVIVGPSAVALSFVFISLLRKIPLVRNFI